VQRDCCYIISSISQHNAAATLPHHSLFSHQSTLPTACGGTIHRLITFIGCREAAWHMVQAGKGSVWNVIAMGTDITIVARTSLVLRLVASSFSSPLADPL